MGRQHPAVVAVQGIVAVAACVVYFVDTLWCLLCFRAPWLPTQGLPKTRSGKIMRRILRKIISQEVSCCSSGVSVCESACRNSPSAGVAWLAEVYGLVLDCLIALQTDSLGDITTLADPGVVADLITRANAAILATKK